MNKKVKKTLEYGAVAVIIFVSFSLRLGINACHRSNYSISNLISSSNEEKPIERINEFTNHLNDICPIYFESWAKIESCAINTNTMNLKICVDDDFIESYNQGTFIIAVHQQFENEISDIDLLKKDMDAENITIKLSICKTDGDEIDNIVLRPKDIFDSPIVHYEENRNLERTLQEADIASKVTPYSVTIQNNN
ncbi:hypothetical protein SAMN04487902_10620 [Prevotella sp. ne3005]|uniref:hypothetical protein n=1 Tax=Prevotella sp. ne3005 TaxID=1761887 RepID=UPI0008D707FB|nr:hypothetical protein [Prevotella sp. ne3005]SEN02278.1 hypothetical protein SAMN04487902_10620 [Prevotella sp. ne3005]